MDEVLDVQFATPLRVMFPTKSPATCRASSSGQKDRMTVDITNSNVFRSADDQNDVLILADVADISKSPQPVGLKRNEIGDGEKRRSRFAQHPLRRRGLSRR
jgi:hypothetical protein